jgi:hypothetical protein
MRFTISTFLEQLDAQFPQLEFLDLAACRFGVSFNIEDMGRHFKHSLADVQRPMRIDQTHPDDGSTVP